MGTLSRQDNETLPAYVTRLDAQARAVPELEEQLAALTLRLQIARAAAAQLAHAERVMFSTPAAKVAHVSGGPTVRDLIASALGTGQAMTPKELAATTGRKTSSVSAALTLMVQAGTLTREDGRYRLSQPQEAPSPPAPAPDVAPSPPERLEARVLRLLADSRYPVTESGLVKALEDATLPAVRGLLRRMRDKGSVTEPDPGKWTLKKG